MISWHIDQNNRYIWTIQGSWNFPYSYVTTHSMFWDYNSVSNVILAFLSVGLFFNIKSNTSWYRIIISCVMLKCRLSSLNWIYIVLSSVILLWNCSLRLPGHLLTCNRLVLSLHTSTSVICTDINTVPWKSFWHFKSFVPIYYTNLFTIVYTDPVKIVEFWFNIIKWRCRHLSHSRHFMMY